MKRVKLASILLIIIGVVIAILLTRVSQSERGHDANTLLRDEVSQESDVEKRARTDRFNAEVSRSLRFYQSAAKLVNDPLDRSNFSEAGLIIDDPSSDDESVRKALHSLLSTLRALSKDKTYPAGLNVEITNVLLGKNARKIAYLPMDSPRINGNGELVDPYGTPYWFHSITSKDMTVTSAGPDRELQTEDDLSYPAQP